MFPCERAARCFSGLNLLAESAGNTSDKYIVSTANHRLLSDERLFEPIATVAWCLVQIVGYLPKKLILFLVGLEKF